MENLSVEEEEKKGGGGYKRGLLVSSILKKWGNYKARMMVKQQRCLDKMVYLFFQ